jgi:hypothetical protein
VAFGKLFTSSRIRTSRDASRSAPSLNAWNAETFTSDGPVGYTDHPALEEKASAAE